MKYVMTGLQWSSTGRSPRPKRSSAGSTIADVPDLDTAIAMAKGWPSLQFPGVAVEIRPIVDHSGG